MLLSEQSHFIGTCFGTILYMRKDIFSSTFGSAVKIQYSTENLPFIYPVSQWSLHMLVVLHKCIVTWEMHKGILALFTWNIIILQFYTLREVVYFIDSLLVFLVIEKNF